jgi:hypothetical protein
VAFLPAVIAAVAPYAAAAGAAATVYSGVKQSQAADYNAQVQRNEQRLATDQAAAQSNLVLRQSREQLGRQAAAFGSAGVGYGGSSEGALDASAINGELDVLNTRYKGQIAGYGYGVQASIDQQEGKTALASSGLMAGAALLKGANSAYSSNIQRQRITSGQETPAQQSGLTTPGS